VAFLASASQPPTFYNLASNLCPSWALVVCAYNPSYLGGRDQQDQSSKPAQANSLRDTILEKKKKKKKKTSGKAGK
jgi:hypothetical protein